MTRRSKFDGVTFIEGIEEGISLICEVSTELNSGFSQDHLKNLDDVKRSLSKKVLDVGGDCLFCFKYGQRNGSVLKQLWSIDNMLWYGSGYAGKMSSGND